MNIILKLIIFVLMTLLDISFASEAGRQTTLESQADHPLSVLIAMKDDWACKKLCDDSDNTEQNKKCINKCLATQRLAAKRLLSLMAKTRSSELSSLVKEFKSIHNDSSSVDELYKTKQLEQ